jgi:hypothetical protein
MGSFDWLLAVITMSCYSSSKRRQKSDRSLHDADSSDHTARRIGKVF